MAARCGHSHPCQVAVCTHVVLKPVSERVPWQSTAVHKPYKLMLSRVRPREIQQRDPEEYPTEQCMRSHCPQGRRYYCRWYHCERTCITSGCDRRRHRVCKHMYYHCDLRHCTACRPHHCDCRHYTACMRYHCECRHCTACRPHHCDRRPCIACMRYHCERRRRLM